MNRLAVTLLLSFITWAANAGVVLEREILAAYGVAHCLHKNATGDTQREAAQALGAYFQSSSYENELAFRAVREFMDRNVKTPLPVYQESGQPAALTVCLDIGQSARYRAVVKAQDRHLPKR